MGNKSKRPQAKQFRLSTRAAARLSNYLTQIRKGIMNVCELHTHDSAPSLSKVDFEEAYIDKILSQTVTAVSVSIRAMTEGLANQKEAEAKAAADNAVINPKGNENKKED